MAMSGGGMEDMGPMKLGKPIPKGQVKFWHVDTSDAPTLDDYEEGQFQPFYFNEDGESVGMPRNEVPDNTFRGYWIEDYGSYTCIGNKYQTIVATTYGPIDMNKLPFRFKSTVEIVEWSKGKVTHYKMSGEVER